MAGTAGLRQRPRPLQLATSGTQRIADLVGPAPLTDRSCPWGSSSRPSSASSASAIRSATVAGSVGLNTTGSGFTLGGRGSRTCARAIAARDEASASTGMLARSSSKVGGSGIRAGGASGGAVAASCCRRSFSFRTSSWSASGPPAAATRSGPTAGLGGGSGFFAGGVRLSRAAATAGFISSPQARH